MRVPAAGGWMNPWRHGTLVFDLEADPAQERPIVGVTGLFTAAQLLWTLE